MTATVQFSGTDTPTPNELVVRDNGKIVKNTAAKRLADTPAPIGVVLAIDTSGSMRERGRIDAAKAAVRSFVAARGATEEVAVVAFSDLARVVHGFTPDGQAAATVEGLTASGETALWDAVSVAVGLFADRPDLQPNVIVLSDGEDTVSTQSADAARAAAIAAHVVVNTVGIAGAGLDNGGLASLASTTGGLSLTTDGADGLTGLFTAVRRSLTQQFELTWKAANAQTTDFAISVGGAVVTGSAAAGAYSRGAETRPELIPPPGVLGRIGAGAGRILAVGFALLAGAVLVLGLGLIRRRPGLDDRIRGYGGGADVAKERQEEGIKTQVSTSFVQRAVEATGQAADRHGLLEWVEARLDAARIPVRPAEACFFTLAFAALACVGAWIAKGPVGGFLALALGLAVPAAATSFLARRRRKKFVKQLPQMLQLLGSSLRAGYSLLQGCEAVSQEINDPMGAELRRVMAEARLGRPVDEALDEAAIRMGSPDFSWAVMAIGIQRNVGGNLAELLDTVADTMTQRDRLRAEVKALTAEGRVSALVLGFMPPGLAVAMAVISPGYLTPLFTKSIGQALLGGALLGMLGGFVWMRKIIQIDM